MSKSCIANNVADLIEIL